MSIVENVNQHFQRLIYEKYASTYPTRKQIVEVVFTEVERLNRDPEFLTKMVKSFRKRLNMVDFSRGKRCKVGSKSYIN